MTGNDTDPDDLDADFTFMADVQEQLDAVDRSLAEAGPVFETGGLLDDVANPAWLIEVEAREREIDSARPKPPVTYADAGWDHGVPTWSDIEHAGALVNWETPQLDLDEAVPGEFPGRVPGDGQTFPPGLRTDIPQTTGPSAAPGSGGLVAGAIAAGVALAAGAIAGAVKSRGERTEHARSDLLWYVSLDGQTNGPYAESDLAGWLAEGRIAPDASVWREGLPEWVTAEQAGLLAAAAPVVPVKLEAVSPRMPPTQWYYVAAGQTLGPVTEDDLIKRLASLPPDTMVWNESLSAWQTAASLGLVRRQSF